jgi:hypothetical protein
MNHRASMGGSLLAGVPAFVKPATSTLVVLPPLVLATSTHVFRAPKSALAAFSRSLALSAKEMERNAGPPSRRA